MKPDPVVAGEGSDTHRSEGGTQSDTRTPNNDEVICPNCVHQFRAIPVNVQKDLSSALELLRECLAYIKVDSEHEYCDSTCFVKKTAEFLSRS